MLKIKKIPVKNDDHPSPRHKVLPKHEFTMGLIAPKGSGKTTLIINLLEFYRDYFHQIVVFSPSIKNDEKWNYARSLSLLSDNKPLRQAIKKIEKEERKKEGVVQNRRPSALMDGADKPSSSNSFTGLIPEDCFITEFNESDLQEIVDQQQEMIDYLKDHGYSKQVANRVLLIFDDLVGSSLYNRSQKSVFKTLNANHRHLSMSMIEVSQAYKEIPKTVRTNFTCLILFKIYNEQEKNVIFDEFPMGLSADLWEKVYRFCTKCPHNFLYYDMSKPQGMQIWENLYQPVKLK